jgi:hypothetical protein
MRKTLKLLWKKEKKKKRKRKETPLAQVINQQCALEVSAYISMDVIM